MRGQVLPVQDNPVGGVGSHVIRGFDGLRAFAVLAVFLFHVNLYKFGFGWLGVSFFFVLSGFLITTILLRMRESLPVKEYFQKFYGRRLLRIFPPYYFYLLVVALLFLLRSLKIFTPLQVQLETVIWPQFPYAFFYVYNFFNAGSKFVISSFLTHFWSLAVEEQFYIIWPLILLLAPVKKLGRIFWVTILLGPIFRLATYLIYTRYNLPFLSEDVYLAVYVLPFSQVDAFATGAYVSQFRIPHARKQLLLVAVVAPILGYLSQYLSTGFVDFDSLGYEFRMWTGYKFIWGYSLLNYFFALVIYNVRHEQLFLPLLEQKFLEYIGRISYGVYIYHVPIIYTIFTYMPNVTFWIRTLLAFAVTIGVAALSYHILEKPILDLKDRFFPLKS